MHFVLTVSQVVGYPNIMKISCRSFAFTSYLEIYLAYFRKQKEFWNYLSLPHFAHIFWRKIFFLLCSINWPNLIVWLPLLCEILGYMYNCNCFLTRLGHHEFWNSSYLSNQLVFSVWSRSYGRKFNILKMGRPFKIKQKAFFIIIKGLSLKQITQILWKVRIRLKSVVVLILKENPEKAFIKPIKNILQELVPWRSTNY